MQIVERYLLVIVTDKLMILADYMISESENFFVIKYSLMTSISDYQQLI